MPVNPNRSYEEFQSADGRWTYGYAQYEKTLADLANPPSSATAAMRAVWPTLDAIMGAVEAYAATQKINFYYIFAIDPNGQKRIAGEWTPLQGGRDGRDLYFDTYFEPAFTVEGISDLVRLESVIPAAQAAPGIPAVATLKAVVHAEAERGAVEGTTKTLLVAAAAGLLVYFLVRKQ